MARNRAHWAVYGDRGECCAWLAGGPREIRTLHLSRVFRRKNASSKKRSRRIDGQAPHQLRFISFVMLGRCF